MKKFKTSVVFQTKEFSFLKWTAALTVLIFLFEPVFFGATNAGEILNSSSGAQLNPEVSIGDRLTPIEQETAAQLPQDEMGFLQSDFALTPVLAPMAASSQTGTQAPSFTSASVMGKLPEGWSAPSGFTEFTKDGSIQLKGNGRWQNLVGPLTDIRDLPSYKIDFTTGANDKEFHVSVDSGTDGLFQRLGIYISESYNPNSQTSTKSFHLQNIDQGKWTDTLIQSVAYKTNQTYTAEFVTLTDGTVEFYLYEKGNARPAIPQGVYDHKNMTKIRFASWLQNGTAQINSIEAVSSVTSKSVRFGSLSSGWAADPGVSSFNKDGSLQLTGNGSWRYFASPQSSMSNLPSYQVDFKVNQSGTGLHVTVDNGLVGSSAYQRFCIFQDGRGYFTVQEAEGTGQGWTYTPLSIAFEINKVYTAEFVTRADGKIELYLYEKGKTRPVQPTHLYDGPVFTSVRYVSWIEKGTAQIESLVASSETLKIQEPKLTVTKTSGAYYSYLIAYEVFSAGDYAIEHTNDGVNWYRDGVILASGAQKNSLPSYVDSTQAAITTWRIRKVNPGDLYPVREGYVRLQGSTWLAYSVDVYNILAIEDLRTGEFYIVTRWSSDRQSLDKVELLPGTNYLLATFKRVSELGDDTILLYDVKNFKLSSEFRGSLQKYSINGNQLTLTTRRTLWLGTHVIEDREYKIDLITQKIVSAQSNIVTDERVFYDEKNHLAVELNKISKIVNGKQVYEVVASVFEYFGSSSEGYFVKGKVIGLNIGQTSAASKLSVVNYLAGAQRISIVTDGSNSFVIDANTRKSITVSGTVTTATFQKSNFTYKTTQGGLRWFSLDITNLITININFDDPASNPDMRTNDNTYTINLVEKAGFNNTTGVKVDYEKIGLPYSYFSIGPNDIGYEGFGTIKIRIKKTSPEPMSLIVKFESGPNNREKIFSFGSGSLGWQEISFTYNTYDSSAWSQILTQVYNILFFVNPGNPNGSGSFIIDDITLVP